MLCDVIKGLHLHKFVEISKKINKRFSLLNEKKNNTQKYRGYTSTYIAIIMEFINIKGKFPFKIYYVICIIIFSKLIPTSTTEQH